MAFATSVPELFVGIVSATRGAPEVSFGNVIGAKKASF
jgi:Ca2+/Na+ antiporter